MQRATQSPLSTWPRPSTWLAEKGCSISSWRVDVPQSSTASSDLSMMTWRQASCTRAACRTPLTSRARQARLYPCSHPLLHLLCPAPTACFWYCNWRGVPMHQVRWSTVQPCWTESKDQSARVNHQRHALHRRCCCHFTHWATPAPHGQVLPGLQRLLDWLSAWKRPTYWARMWTLHPLSLLMTTNSKSYTNSHTWDPLSVTTCPSMLRSTSASARLPQP